MELTTKEDKEIKKFLSLNNTLTYQEAKIIYLKRMTKQQRL